MTKHYLSNKELYCEMLVSKAQGKLTRNAQKMLIILATRINRKFYYVDPEDRKDCLQEALFDVFKFWYNFDELKTTNAFSYFTEIIKRGHAKSWNKIEKNREDVSLNAFFKEDGDINI